jgi:general stress protein 26
MTRVIDIDESVTVATKIMDAAGCASIITIDESGLPTSRPVRTFPTNGEIKKIIIPSDENSRKTQQVRKNSNVVLAYVDVSSRGYVTLTGHAELNNNLEDKKALWIETFSSFWPEGPESNNFVLIDFKPSRIEIRSYTQGVAEIPTDWVPLTLERSNGKGWRLTA